MREVAKVFLRLGLIGFGGPVAHLALMEEELCERRKWLTREHFLDLVGLTNLIPGPNSTEMAIHLGYLRAGWKGLLVAGACFLLPAVVLTTAVAWLYRRYGTLAPAQAAFKGIAPVVIAVIAAAAWRLGRTAVRNVPHALLCAACVAAVLLGLDPVLVLFAGIVVGIPVTRRALSAPPLPLFLVFLKVGAVLYGSGYVLVAFLEDELVGRGWITEQQLLDAVAVGQVTPGPVLSTATFLGYGLGGVPGALVATVGIFLPSFVFVAMLGPLAARLRGAAWTGPFLASVRVVSFALLVAVLAQFCVRLDGKGGALAVVALAASVRFKVAAHWLILAGALVGSLYGA
ncbi:MAG TPA: chromate transporter [Planctomycetota bacterium]|nr:chromate transporter [Planctomycetota bacterium]